MRRFWYYGASSAGGLDPDALAFLTAAGITDPTITTAINDLVVSLKADSLWTKFRYIYPFVGGTATTNKYNLRDPQDLDAAFRLDFYGGITHTNGFNPNGTNGYGDTFCTPSGNVTLNSEHLYITSNTNNTPTSNDPVDTGTFINTSIASLLLIKDTNNFARTRLNSSLISSPNTNAIGSYCATKTSTDLRLFKNAVLLNNGLSNGSLSTSNILIGNTTVGSFTYNQGYTNQNYTFASFGDGLTDTDVANLTTIEQTFNTALGR